MVNGYHNVTRENSLNEDNEKVHKLISLPFGLVGLIQNKLIIINFASKRFQIIYQSHFDNTWQSRLNNLHCMSENYV